MNRVRKAMIGLIAILAIGLVGCGKSKTDLSSSLTDKIWDGTEGGGNGNGDTGSDVPPPGWNDEVPDGAFQTPSVGAVATLKPVSTERMSDYAMRTLFAPSNVQVHVVLDNFGGGAIGGYVKITYDDLGKRVEAKFSSGNNAHDAQFNKWFKKDGKEVFHGFFEDENGAIVLVVDKITDLGDGGSASLVSGSVWFKNHRPTSAPNPSNGCLPNFGCPNTRCWFVKEGPYECRAFVQNDEIRTTSRVTPNNGYVKLGTFKNLDRNGAFAGH